MLAQIVLLDVVFSPDSVITAAGMATEVPVVVAAVALAVGVLLLAAGAVSAFVERHPTVKLLALRFLLLIGFSLVAEGLGLHLPKGYVYVAIGSSVLVEALNLAAPAPSSRGRSGQGESRPRGRRGVGRPRRAPAPGRAAGS